MHILHLVHQYLPENVGGTELYTQNVAQIQAQRGHDVSVFYPFEQAVSSVELVQGVRVHRVAVGERGRTTVFLNSFHQPALTDAIKPLLKQVDLVHIQHLMGLPLTLVDQIRAAGVPYVITLHDYWYPCANAQLMTNYDQTICAGPDRRWLNCGKCAMARAGLNQIAGKPVARPIAVSTLAPLMRYRHKNLLPVLGGAACVIAPTQFVKNVYERTGFDQGNMIVLKHGIEIPVAQTMAAAKETAPRYDEFHVAYVGSIAHQKGVHVLIEAFNLLPHEGVRLTIAGDLTKFPDYVNELRTRATHPNIHFLGRIPHEEVWGVLFSADSMILPTLWYEASPLSIDEFFAAGVPIIASDIGAMTEKIRHDVDGLLVPPAQPRALREAILRLQQNPQFLVTLRDNIQPVRTIDLHVDELEACYRSCK